MKEYQEDIEAILRKLTAPRRNHYYYGKMMDVLHFKMEQRYVNQKRWLMNRLLQGEGVAAGWEGSPRQPAARGVRVALDSLGRDVIVPARSCSTPEQFDPCGRSRRAAQGPGADGHAVHLLHECLTDYAPGRLRMRDEGRCRPARWWRPTARTRSGRPEPPTSIPSEMLAPACAAEGATAPSTRRSPWWPRSPSAAPHGRGGQRGRAVGGRAATDTPTPRAHVISVAARLPDDRRRSARPTLGA